MAKWYSMAKKSREKRRRNKNHINTYDFLFGVLAVCVYVKSKWNGKRNEYITLFIVFAVY